MTLVASLQAEKTPWHATTNGAHVMRLPGALRFRFSIHQVVIGSCGTMQREFCRTLKLPTRPIVATVSPQCRTVASHRHCKFKNEDDGEFLQLGCCTQTCTFFPLGPTRASTTYFGHGLMLTMSRDKKPKASCDISRGMSCQGRVRNQAPLASPRERFCCVDAAILQHFNNFTLGDGSASGQVSVA